MRKLVSLFRYRPSKAENLAILCNIGFLIFGAPQLIEHTSLPWLTSLGFTMLYIGLALSNHLRKQEPWHWNSLFLWLGAIEYLVIFLQTYVI